MPLITMDEIRARYGCLVEPGYRLLELHETIAFGDRKYGMVSEQWSDSMLVNRTVASALNLTPAIGAYARLIVPPFPLPDGYYMLHGDAILDDDDLHIDIHGGMGPTNNAGRLVRETLARYPGIIVGYCRRRDARMPVSPQGDLEQPAEITPTHLGEWEDAQ